MATLDADDKNWMLNTLVPAIKDAVVQAVWTTKLKFSSGAMRRAYVAANPDKFPDGKDDGRDILFDPWTFLQWCVVYGLRLTDPRVGDVPVVEVRDAVQELLAKPAVDVDAAQLAEALVAAGIGGVSDDDVARIKDATSEAIERTRLTVDTDPTQQAAENEGGTS